MVARIDAHSLAPEGTSRLSYCRTVFHTRPASLLASRTPTQIGAELYGVAGTSADVEIISVMLSLLSEAGIEGVHLDLGNVGVFRALADSAGLSDEQQSELFDLLKLKCQTDTLAWVERELSDSRLTEAFSLVASMQGSASALTDKFARLAELVPVAAQQLSDMTQAIEALMQRFPQVSITCDLTELRGYDYHTGLVFAAYVPGYGDAVAQGGRYDETGADFGRARPATGFSADLKVLAALGQRQFEAKETVAAPASDDPSLWQAITDLRTKGYRVVTEANGDVAGASQRLQQNDGQWTLVSA